MLDTILAAHLSFAFYSRGCSSTCRSDPPECDEPAGRMDEIVQEGERGTNREGRHCRMGVSQARRRLLWTARASGSRTRFMVATRGRRIPRRLRLPRLFASRS